MGSTQSCKCIGGSYLTQAMGGHMGISAGDQVLISQSLLIFLPSTLQS